jgi:hypothetical protein
MVEMDLHRIVIREGSDHQYVFLREKEGSREFPIVIGVFEAMEIRRKVKELATPRPTTHDLVGRVLDALGGKLERVIVNELKNNTFFAQLVIQTAGGVREVDSRPSDAIALALQTRAPIYVDEKVIREVTQI